MQKSKLFLTGMAALLLTFGLVLVGCPMEDEGGGGGDSTTLLSVGSKADWDAAVTTMQGGKNKAKYVITLSGDLDLNKDALLFAWDDAEAVAITIKGEGHTIRLNTDSQGALFSLSDQTLVLENVTLEGINKMSQNESLVHVGSDASLTMNNGAKITGNGYGGVSVNGSLVMNNGAEISDNSGRLAGGGVSVYADGSFTMNGGTISGNKATNYGGGVYVYADGRFVKTGGTVYGNDATDALKNTAIDNSGHAVFYLVGAKSRDKTAGPTINIDISNDNWFGDKDPPGGGGDGATATITGTLKVGQTLTATFSGFTPSSDDIYWKSAGSPTGESTGNISFGSNTYSITNQDEGNYIWVEASNDDHSIEAVSPRVGPIEAAGGNGGSGATPTQFQFTGAQVSIRTDGTFPEWYSTNPTSEGFTITVNGTPQTIESVFTSNNEKVYIDIEDDIPSGATVTVSYDGTTGYFAGKLKGFTDKKATYK
jgi:hypothetical protein